jgi:RHS repeat-associated protein
VTGTRYYSHAGRVVAMRTAAGGVSWLMSDQQGTSMIALTAGDQTATQRRETPFGAPRGSVPSWPNEKGFVGGTMDPTGTTHLGAREYDPTVGRFISADPVIDHGDPQQQNGYAYANNSPVTMSDPSGRRFCDGDGCAGGAITPSQHPAAQPDPAPVSSDPPAHKAPAKHGGGSGHWWDQAWNKASSGFHTAVNWAEKHKAEIAGVAVGIAVGVGCGVAIGWTGVGAVACGALAGAVGSMVTYALATPAKERSLGGLLVAGAIGAATGALTVGIGAKVAPLVGAVARVAGAKIAQGVARTAVQRVVGASASAAAKIGGGSAGRAAEGADHLVLGKSLGLESRAAQIGGRHLMNETDWQGAVTRAVGDPSTKISVALDGVEGAGSTYGRVMSAVQRSASGRGTPFDWEMQQLHEAGRLAKADFWEGGQILGNPFR